MKCTWKKRGPFFARFWALMSPDGEVLATVRKDLYGFWEGYIRNPWGRADFETAEQGKAWVDRTIGEWS